MNLADYVRVITQRGWIILLAVVLTAGSAFVFSKLQTPIYRSTQEILIKPARADLGLTDTLKQLLEGWTERLRTQLRAQDAIDALKLDMTAADLAGQVTVTADVNSFLITIDADMKDGEVGNQVARTYGEQFVQWRVQENQPLQLSDRINAELLDAPKYTLLKPNTKINVAAGALLGILIGGVVIFVLEYIDSNVVRRSKDVERFLQLPVLGTLPDTQQ